MDRRLDHFYLRITADNTIIIIVKDFLSFWACSTFSQDTAIDLTLIMTRQGFRIMFPSIVDVDSYDNE